MDGNLYIDNCEGVREFRLEKTCHESHLHAHHYDHRTVVISGRIRVTCIYERDGIEAPGEDREYGIGEEALIAAGVKHVIKALAPNTVYQCRFSHRDWDGEIVHEFTGNYHAFQ